MTESPNVMVKKSKRICECGDYEHQHDDRGCLICRTSTAPWDNCRKFRPVGN